MNPEPYFSKLMKKRISLLTERLKNSEEENYDKVLALFAIEYGLTDKKVREYFKLISASGLLN